MDRVRRPALAVLLACLGPAGVGTTAHAQWPTQCAEATGVADEQAILAFDGELRLALAADDPTYLTLLSRYPLRVNEAGGAIYVADAATLHSQADAVFPDVLRSQVLGAAAMDPVCSSSGIGYANGRLWAGVRRHGDTERFEIYSVNLPAAPVENDEGVTFVCRTDELRSVVHRRADGTFRFRSWNAPRPIGEAPDLDLISERSDTQGTGVCAHRIYSFEDGPATYSVSEIGCPATSPPDNAVGIFSIGIDGVETMSAWCH